MRRQFWHEGGPRHARLGIHFKADQLARAAGRVVKTEVGSRNSSATERMMCLEG